MADGARDSNCRENNMFIRKRTLCEGGSGELGDILNKCLKAFWFTFEKQVSDETYLQCIFFNVIIYSFIPAFTISTLSFLHSSCLCN